MWLNIGLSWKIKELCVLWLFFKIDWSSTKFDRSWRELSINAVEHRSFLKNDQITLYPHLIFTSKTGKHSLKQRYLFHRHRFLSLGSARFASSETLAALLDEEKPLSSRIKFVWLISARTKTLETLTMELIKRAVYANLLRRQRGAEALASRHTLRL